MVISPSLKEALRQRPNVPQAHPGQNGARYSATDRQLLDWAPELQPRRPYDLVPGAKGTYTVQPLWTQAEFRTFRHLLERSMSPRISEAADGRVWLRRFKEQHGEEICEMMLMEIRRQDELAWFKNKSKFKGA